MGESTLMATNNFKAFAVGSGANVTSQADYEELTALLSGFQSGKASSAQINKALRQGSTISAVIAQFIADKSGNDVLDNGNTATILTNFIAALKANIAASNANYFVDTGAANAIVISPVPAMTALADGQVFDISCAAANTGAVTLKVNALNAFPIVGSAGALKGGEIGSAKGVIRVIWSDTNKNFLLLEQNTGGPIQVAQATQSNHAPQLSQVLQAADGTALPFGTPIPWPSSTPPTGWITMSGQSITSTQYPKLYALYGPNLPDLRGEFIRGWDNARGVDSGRGVLTSQRGSVLLKDTSDSVASFNNTAGDTNTVLDWDATQRTDSVVINTTVRQTTTVQPLNNTSYMGISRPRNIAFNYIVRGI